MKIRILIILLFCMYSISSASDTLSPGQVLMKTQLIYSNLKDFSVKAKVIADIPNFRMPVKTIEFYYKDPDMFEAKTKGFALVPKYCLLPFSNSNKILRTPQNFKINKRVTIDKKKYIILQYINDNDKLKNKILFWVDAYLWRIDKINILQQDKLLSTIDFSYQNLDGFWLPDTTLFTMIFPKGIPNASGPSISDPFGGSQFGTLQNQIDLEGQVKIIFSDYKINKGIDDNFFENRNEIAH